MNRKLVGGLVLLVVGLIAVWALWLRGGGGDRASDAAGGGARSGKVSGAGPGQAPREAAIPRDATSRMPRRWALDPDREGATRLEGQVVGPDGKGVAGADVWLSSVPPRRAKSDEDGSFAFDKLVERTYQLSAKQGELIGGPVTYKLTAKSDPVVVRLAEGASVVVTVVDEAQQPVAGAEVRGGEPAERGSARTDARGEATIRPVHPGYVAVTAAAQGYAPGGGFTTIGSPGAVGHLKITLRKGFPVSGRVIDEAGAPVGLAKVSVRGGWWTRDDDDDGEAGDGDGAPAAPRLAITDRDGKFTIPAVASGTHRLSAVDGVHAPATSEPVTVGDGAVTGVTITMTAGGTLSGRVADTAGKPVPYATVQVGGAGRAMWMVAARRVTCDDQGAFEIRGIPRGKLSVRAESDQAASRIIEVDLTERGRQEVKLVLEVAGVIAGKVIDDKGAAVAEIQVTARPELDDGEGFSGLALAGMTSAMTDGAGEFTIRGLPEGSYKLVAARAVRMFEWGQPGTRAKTGDRNVVVRLPAPGALKGTLALHGGGAPRHALVQVGPQPPTPAQGGAFEVKNVTPGTYDVVFRGLEFAELVQRNVKIEPGKTTDLGVVTVHRGRRVGGKVVDPAGRPVAGAKVRLGEMLFSVEGGDDASSGMEDLSGIRSAITGPDGEFAIAGVSAKSMTAAAEHASHGRSNPVTIAEGTQDPPPVVLALRGFGSISGKVVLKAAPQANVMITQSSKGGGAQLAFARTDERGTFTLAKVPEGEHVLQAMMQAGPGTHRSTSVTVKVTAGQDAKVTIDIPVGQLTLTVQPKALPGHKIDSAQVFLFTGHAAPTNGKQIFELFVQGGAVGSKIWFGASKPVPEFPELLPGDYSICTLPINGDLNDPTFAQRLMRDSALLKVYCRPMKLAASPLKQSIVHEVPSMTPLPEN